MIFRVHENVSNYVTFNKETVAVYHELFSALILPGRMPFSQCSI